MTKTHKADALLRLAAQWQHGGSPYAGGDMCEWLRGYDMVHPLATFLHWLDEAAK